MITEGIYQDISTGKVIELGNLKLKQSHIIGVEDTSKNGYYAKTDVTGKVLIEEVQQHTEVGLNLGMLTVTLIAIISADNWVRIG